MSAYGSFLGPKAVGELESYRYPIANGILTTHPVTASEAPRDLVEYLYQVFSQELEGVSWRLRIESILAQIKADVL